MSKRNAKKSSAMMEWMRMTSVRTFAACGILLGAGMMQSCEKDILTGQPEWLGNSIYERLQEGITLKDGTHKTFNYTLRLIDDLGYTSTLSKTGSRTLFATPDDVMQQYFDANGINYDELTLARKRALINNSMINNAYLVELMSNISGNPPQEDYCMRRQTSATIYDSIPVFRVADMPHYEIAVGETTIDTWKTLRDAGKDVAMFKDATSAPMIHFLPGFMQRNNITDEDLRIITNGTAQSTQESWINGLQVVSDEQTCKNGYIYVINGVVDNIRSMAQIINDEPRMSTWAGFLSRWSCPVPMTGSSLREYQSLFNTQDTVYNLRYFNSGSTHKLLQAPNYDDRLKDTEVLLYDPGWNQYMYQSATKDLHYDAGAMFVPTNEAVDYWWNSDDAKGLREQYGAWENVPLATMAELININMQESFIESVPSKFNSVLDDSKQKELGIKPEHIEKCFMGCNGVVYMVNKVFSPVIYRSVMGPALSKETTIASVAYNMLRGMYPSNNSMAKDNTTDFTPYLNAMDSKFTVILPSVAQTSVNPSKPEPKVFRFIDPCSYGTPTLKLFEFCTEKGVTKGYSYDCTVEDGVVVLKTPNATNLSDAVIKNRLYNLLDNNIIVHDHENGETTITPSKLYYSTKAGSIVKAWKNGDKTMIEGGYQMANNQTVVIDKADTYDMQANGGNGTTYFVATSDDQQLGIPMTSPKSVYDVIKEQAALDGSKCKLFLELLEGDESTNSILSALDGTYKCLNNTKNFSIFDNYNYTVYVPSDEAVQKLMDENKLPTWEDYRNADEASDQELMDSIAARIHDFVRYHVQDRAVCIGGDVVNGENYESSKLNPRNNRYYSFKVSANASNCTVTDYLGNTYNVITDETQGGFYNKICREYWIKGTPGTVNATLEVASDAVVHQINGALMYENWQPGVWRK